ncbi:MAG: S8 family serine peptidase [Thermomicrobiales bacterium]|nr:S8 family serine peptidase [Thermomicrobiales bacterium]
MTRRTRRLSLITFALLVLASLGQVGDAGAAMPSGRVGPYDNSSFKDDDDAEAEEPDEVEVESPEDDDEQSPDDQSDDGSGGDDDSDGADDSGSSSNDDSGSDGGHGNDDDSRSRTFESPDGAQAPIVDDDDDPETDGYRSGQVIVHLHPAASIDAFNERHGTTTVAGVIGEDLYLLQLPDETTADSALDALTVDPDTRWVELNYVNQAPEGRPGYFFVSGEATTAPGESYAPTLLGYGGEAQSCATGAGVTIAVLDTGIDATHPALAGRIADGGWNALNDSGETGDLGNDRDDDADGLVDEMVGHGTHVAGIIAQVAPNASILPVKVLGSDGVGDAFYVAAGIYYAVDQDADVINLSLSSTYDARVVAEAVAVANERGVMIVAAAGNAGTNRVLEVPAADTGVIAVASTDATNLKRTFSNFGDQIDISAPGEAIVSALPGGVYAAWSGTSMAAPFVSATSALLLDVNPDWHAADIADHLAATALPLDDLNPDYAGELGEGRLDVASALDCRAKADAA